MERDRSMWYVRARYMNLCQEMEEVRKVSMLPKELIEGLQLHPLCVICIEIDALLPPPHPRGFTATDRIFKRFFDVADPILRW